MTSSSIVAAAIALTASSAVLAGQAQVDLSKAKLRTPAQLKEKAPDVYKARFDTSAGVFVVEVHREWAPLGADRFYNLVKNGFYDDVRFFRVVPNFMVQFGMNGNPSIQAIWQNQNLMDDPVKESNKRGLVTFANAGPNSRSTQVFVNYKDNSFLDRQNFAPFGLVVEGLEVVEKLNPQYREQPSQGAIRSQGNAYLTKEFPKLDFVKKATIVGR